MKKYADLHSMMYTEAACFNFYVFHRAVGVLHASGNCEETGKTTNKNACGLLYNDKEAMLWFH